MRLFLETMKHKGLNRQTNLSLNIIRGIYFRAGMSMTMSMTMLVAFIIYSMNGKQDGFYSRKH